MKVSSKYKRFKHSTIMGDTFTLLDMRSSIIRTIWRYHSHKNTANLRRFEKEAQINEIDTPKTDKTLSVSDRALLALSYADMIITDHTVRPDVSRPSVSTSHGRVNTKPKTYLIIEMIPHHLVFYSYERKYHKLSSMFNTGYQCSNIYIDIEKGALMNKDIQ